VRVGVEFGELPVRLPAEPQHRPQHAPPVFIDDVRPDASAQPGRELSLCSPATPTVGAFIP
jgi:hypothetical protein